MSNTIQKADAYFRTVYGKLRLRERDERKLLETPVLFPFPGEEYDHVILADTETLATELRNLPVKPGDHILSDFSRSPKRYYLHGYVTENKYFQQAGWVEEPFPEHVEATLKQYREEHRRVVLGQTSREVRRDIFGDGNRYPYVSRLEFHDKQEPCSLVTRVIQDRNGKPTEVKLVYDIGQDEIAPRLRRVRVTTLIEAPAVTDQDRLQMDQAYFQLSVEQSFNQNWTAGLEDLEDLEPQTEL